MADEPDEKFLGIQSFPKVPEFEPDVGQKQTQWVRYGNSVRNIATREGWQLAKSEKQSVAESGEERRLGQPLGPGLTRTLSPLARARAPERITLRVSQAPGIFSLPLKVKKTIRPNFKVNVSVSYRSGTGVSFVCTVRAFVLTETDRSDLPAWRDTLEDAQSWLSGTAAISHVFDDTVEQADAQNHNPEAMRQASLHKQGSMGGYVPEGMAPDSMLNTSPFGSVELGMNSKQVETSHRTDIGHSGPEYSAARQIRQQASGAGRAAGDLKHMSHEFEFAELKIIKPSRMKKVYMLFAVSILDRDQLFAVFHVPTIVIAHITNQGVRALESLQGHVERPPVSDTMDEESEPANTAQGAALPSSTLPMPPELGALGISAVEFDDNFSPLMAQRGFQPASPAISHGTPHLSQGHAMLQQPVMGGQFGGMNSADRMQGFAATGGRSQWEQLGAFNMGGMLDVTGGLAMDRQGSYASPDNSLAAHGVKEEPPSISIQDVREYVVTKYETAGLTRTLTEMDIRILEVQAGFPETYEGRRSGMQISREQWHAFQSWYDEMISLLTRIRITWNKSDPTAVAGFDVGRAEASRALANLEPGTFMIRLSLSSPGSVVLSIKRPDIPESDVSGVVHALLEKGDLDGRRIDTWIRDFPYAQVLLDPYTGKQIDKQSVCMPDYVRLAAMDEKCDRDKFGYK